MPPSAPAVDLSMLLNQSSHALTNRMSGALAEVGLSVRIYCVLVKAVEGDYTQGKIAELAWMDKTTMVSTLDEMEKLGLAERKLSPTDRRVRVVSVTAAGRKALDRGHRVVQGVYDEVLAGIGKKDRATFLAVLESVVAGPLAAPFHLERPVRRRRERSLT
ncbi:MAG: MarR family winged helix-turn-helix transcriptional regulator [Solirubrobacteraceae bacterium]|nr:MarR family winged helix-turn-helix transcriptional regulator [Patulibacter sp.]